MRPTIPALAAIVLVSCSGGSASSAAKLGSEDGALPDGYQDHTSIPEPNTHVCGVKYEGSSFEGVPATSWDAIWVKSGDGICCVAGECPAEFEGPASCACYAATVDAETEMVSVGFAPGYIEGPQERPEGWIECRDISFVMFEAACVPTPDGPADGDGASCMPEPKDHTYTPEPNTQLCGVKYEGKCFDGVPATTWDAIWVKSGEGLCCIAGTCPEEMVAPASCGCYAATVDSETGAVSVGFAPGYVEGAQETPEGPVQCADISFVLFEAACVPPPP